MLLAFLQPGQPSPRLSCRLPVVPAATVALLLLAGCAGLPGFPPTPAANAPAPAAQSAPPAAPSAEEAAVVSAFTNLGFYPARLASNVIRLDLPTNDSFASGSADLTAPTQRTLDGIAGQFNSPLLRGWQLLVVGHADDRGSAGDNDVMSLARANNVMRHLVARGTDAGRLRAEGRGEREPLVSNDRRYGRELNRRVELFLHQGPLPAGITAPR